MPKPIVHHQTGLRQWAFCAMIPLCAERTANPVCFCYWAWSSSSRPNFLGTEIAEADPAGAASLLPSDNLLLFRRLDTPLQQTPETWIQYIINPTPCQWSALFHLKCHRTSMVLPKENVTGGAMPARRRMSNKARHEYPGLIQERCPPASGKERSTPPHKVKQLTGTESAKGHIACPIHP